MVAPVYASAGSAQETQSPSTLACGTAHRESLINEPRAAETLRHTLYTGKRPIPLMGSSGAPGGMASESAISRRWRRQTRLTERRRIVGDEQRRLLRAVEHQPARRLAVRAADRTRIGVRLPARHARGHHPLAGLEHAFAKAQRAAEQEAARLDAVAPHELLEHRRRIVERPRREVGVLDQQRARMRGAHERARPVGVAQDEELAALLAQDLARPAATLQLLDDHLVPRARASAERRGERRGGVLERAGDLVDATVTRLAHRR